MREKLEVIFHEKENGQNERRLNGKMSEISKLVDQNIGYPRGQYMGSPRTEENISSRSKKDMRQ
jgi:hypothetical protein